MSTFRMHVMNNVVQYNLLVCNECMHEAVQKVKEIPHGKRFIIPIAP